MSWLQITLHNHRTHFKENQSISPEIVELNTECLSSCCSIGNYWWCWFDSLLLQRTWSKSQWEQFLEGHFGVGAVRFGHVYHHVHVELERKWLVSKIAQNWVMTLWFIDTIHQIIGPRGQTRSKEFVCTVRNVPRMLPMKDFNRKGEWRREAFCISPG